MMFVLLAAMMISTAQTQVFTYDFETEFDSVFFHYPLGEWTTIDANGDGFDWFNGHDLGTEMGRNGTNGFAISESAHYPYALSPDNYLVSPRFLAANDSYISFYACSHDLYYPLEHFGVAVSTASNDNPDDFVTIAEWTIPDTGEGDGQTPYLEYTADLSAYAGQEIYVAIRHFDCTDQYKLDIDDITIVANKPEVGMSGYVLSTSTYWGIVRFGLNRFETDFTNTTWLSNADGFYGGAAVANGVMYGTTVYQELYKFNLEDGSWEKSSTNKYWEDMAYDYTTNTMYCIIENGFGKLDLETGLSTLIKFYPNTYFWGIGCTHDGRLYAVGQDGYLYSIDKETGNEEIIGNTGLVSQYICCAAIDPNTDIMYFEHCTDASDKLYKIDLETAQPTFVCDYDEISGLSFDYNPDDPTEIPETSSDDIEATVYPNPTRDDILVKADGLKHVTVTNSLGQTVMSVDAASDALVIDMRQYGVGVYVVCIETENGIRTRKIVVTE